MKRGLKGVFVVAVFLVVLLFLIWILTLPSTSFVVKEERNFVTGNIVNFNASPGKVMIYDNVRFRTRDISYEIDNNCSKSQNESLRKGFGIMSNISVLNFYEVNFDPDIYTICFNERNKTLGEGGPNVIFNGTDARVIINGTIKMYGEEKCEKPITVLHEIFHVLGFAHSTDNSSLMYEKVNCESEIDGNLITKINTLYDRDLPELFLSDLEYDNNRKDPKLNVKISNLDKWAAGETEITIFEAGREVYSYLLNNVGYGKIIYLSIQNLKINEKKEIILSLGDRNYTLYEE